MSTACTVQELPLVWKETDGLRRKVRITLHQTTSLELVEVTIKLGNAYQATHEIGSLAAGRNEFDIDIPEPTEATSLTTQVTTNGKSVCEVSKTVAPAKPWNVYLMHQSHFDIGYTDLQKHIYALQKRNIDQLLEYIGDTDNESDDNRFRWTVECTYPLLKYFEDRPESVIKRLLAQVQKGNIEVAASLFTLHSEFCSPEELIRSFYPVAKLRKLGIPIETAIQSDVPGTVAMMPRVLNNIGISRLAMAPNNHRAPFHDAYDNKKLSRPFHWTSGYGDRVLTWITDLPDHVYQEGNILGFLDDLETVEKRLPARLLQLENDGYAFNTVGLRIQGSYSDNGMPNFRIPQITKEFNDKYVIPKVRNATFGEFFEQIEQDKTVTIPTFKGEWPDWWAEGVGSAPRELSMIRKAQEKVQYAQTMLSHSIENPVQEYPSKRFEKAWELLALSDEHTWGAAQPQQNDLRRFASGELQWGMKKSYMYQSDMEAERLEDLANSHLSEFVGTSNHTRIVVTNSLSWNRTDVVKVPLGEVKQWLPGSTSWKVVDESNGCTIKTQIVSNGSDISEYLVFIAADVPANGYRNYRIEINDTAASDTLVSTHERNVWKPTLDNGFFHIETCPLTGSFIKIIDKQTGKNLVPDEHSFQLNQWIHQKIQVDHSYLIRQQIKEQHTDSHGWVKKVEKGDVFDRMIIRTTCGELQMNKEITIYHALKRIDVNNMVVKPQEEQKEALFLSLPFNIDDGTMRLETVGDWIIPGENQIPGSCPDWYVTRKYVDVSNDNWGVSVALKDTPMVQLGDIRIPSVRNTDFDSFDTKHLYIYAANNLWPTNFPHQQGGELQVEYSIIPHEGEFDPVFSDKESSGFLVPLRPILQGKNVPTNEAMSKAKSSWLEVDGDDNVTVLSSSRNETGSFVLRLVEVAGEKGHTTVRFSDRKIAKLVEANVIEEEISECSKLNENSFQATLQPKEIKTYIIHFKE